jgi:hypothetical protein
MLKIDTIGTDNFFQAVNPGLPVRRRDNDYLAGGS